MSKLVVINKHDGGMVNDPRDPRTDVQRSIQHFDNYTNPKKLTPYRSFKQDGTEATLNGYEIQTILAANSTIYGVGVASGGAYTQVYIKTTSTDPTSVWTTAVSGTSSSSLESFKMLCYYNALLYGGNSTGVWSYDPVGESFTYNAWATLPKIPTGQAIIHSLDDIMYFPSNNLICYNNAGTFGVGFTLPTGTTINGICEFGNYLAIMFTTADEKVVVGMWDRDTTNTAFDEKIDWGRGTGGLIETIEGTLVGISYVGGTGNSFIPRLQFKSYEYSYLSSYEGINTVNIFAEYILSASPTITQGSALRFNQLFYFLAVVTTIEGVVLNGIWKIFRNTQGAMAVSFDQLPMNGTSTPTTLYGLTRWGDYMFVTLEDPGNSDYTIYRTLAGTEGVLYTATSEWDTTINQGMPPDDAIEKKKLLAVTALYEPLPSGASVTVQYRVDGGSWTTIFTESATGVVRSIVATNAGANGAFTDGYEYEFRLQSTGGAEITALVYKYDIIKTQTNS